MIVYKNFNQIKSLFHIIKMNYKLLTSKQSKMHYKYICWHNVSCPWKWLKYPLVTLIMFVDIYLNVTILIILSISLNNYGKGYINNKILKACSFVTILMLLTNTHI